MKLESGGILIGMRPFGERDCVAHIFTRDWGVLCGMMRGAVVARKNKPMVGQVGCASWNARLDSQLGVFHWESAKNLSAPLMDAPKILGYMNSVFALIAAMLPERENYAALYDKTLGLLESLAVGQSDSVLLYLEWEKNLLGEMGYALNLSKCSGCGSIANLEYLSPRTGRAVCIKCAQPYLDKLFKLPLTLGTTQKFLEKVCEQHGIVLPAARRLLGI